MIILTIKTDKPEAEIGLYHDETQLGYVTWQAHRELSETLHARIAELLKQFHKELTDLDGIIAYAGPGSFTGLRIGISAVNALSYSLYIPAVGATTTEWINLGLKLLHIAKQQPVTQVMPMYGGPVHTTLPRK